jgi:hypothetical protein
MPTFEELYTIRLDRELNSNDSNSLYTSTRRQAAINEAVEEFADLTECFLRQSSITCSCNVSEYMVLSSGVLGGSTDFVRLAKQGIEYRVKSSGSTRTWITYLAGDDDFPERPIEWLNRFDPGWRQSTSPTIPSGWYRRTDGGNLYLGLNRPPKIGSSQQAELIVPYVAKPAAMSSASDLPFTVNSSVRYDLTVYHKALPHYAAYKLLPLIGDQERADSQLSKFMGFVARFLAGLRPRGGTHVTLGRSYLQNARRRGDGDRSSVPPSQWS